MNAPSRIEATVDRPLKVHLSEFSVGALARSAPRDSSEIRARCVRAVRFYLHEADSPRPGWSVPSSLRGEEPGAVELELELDERLREALETEAGKQGVSVSRLVSQAAIFYAAEFDAGRITQRVLDDLESDA
jgi:hypothetical protein